MIYWYELNLHYSNQETQPCIWKVNRPGICHSIFKVKKPLSFFSDGWQTTKLLRFLKVGKTWIIVILTMFFFSKSRQTRKHCCKAMPCQVRLTRNCFLGDSHDSLLWKKPRKHNLLGMKKQTSVFFVIFCTRVKCIDLYRFFVRSKGFFPKIFNNANSLRGATRDRVGFYVNMAAVNSICF